MKRIPVGLGVILASALIVLVPLAQAQDDGAGYTELWRQWRLREIAVYPDAVIDDADGSQVSVDNYLQARGYTELWRQWRLREIQSYASRDTEGNGSGP